MRCEERCEDGAVTRSVLTWHPVKPDRRGQQSSGSSRAPRRSRSTRRHARPSGSSESPSLSAQRGSCDSTALPVRARNARQRRSAERSAQHHATIAAKAANATAGDTSAVVAVATAAADISAAAPAPSSKRARDDEPSRAPPSLTGGVVGWLLLQLPFPGDLARGFELVSPLASSCRLASFSCEVECLTGRPYVRVRRA